MADVLLTAQSINDGTLIEDINAKIKEATENLEAYPELKSGRTITVKIKLTPDSANERIMHTEASVDSKFPVPGRSGVAWKKDGVLQTSTEIREGDGTQIDLERRADELAERRADKSARS